MVDDEKSLLNLLREYLEREGFEVYEALDGPAALEVARDVKPEVVILDWMLPGLDGMEVLRRMRQFSEAYVIMLTARTEEVDRIVGLSSGADDYLSKPVLPRRTRRPGAGDVATAQGRGRRGKRVGPEVRRADDRP